MPPPLQVIRQLPMPPAPRRSYGRAVMPPAIVIVTLARTEPEPGGLISHVPNATRKGRPRAQWGR